MSLELIRIMIVSKSDKICFYIFSWFYISLYAHIRISTPVCDEFKQVFYVMNETRTNLTCDFPFKIPEKNRILTHPFALI